MYRNLVCVYIFCKTKCSLVFLGYVQKCIHIPSISQMTFEQILKIKWVPCQLLLLPICTQLQHVVKKTKRCNKNQHKVSSKSLRGWMFRVKLKHMQNWPTGQVYIPANWVARWTATQFCEEILVCSVVESRLPSLNTGTLEASQ